MSDGDEPPTYFYNKNINDFDKHLPETVTVLYGPNSTRVYLVGTAHVSKKSEEDVAKVIRAVRPNVVVIELCPSRLGVTQLDDKKFLEEAKTLNMRKVKKSFAQHGVSRGLVYVLFLKMYAKQAKKLNVAPGGEFRRAILEAAKIPNCEVYLGDRPIQITMRRALARMSLLEKMFLYMNLFFMKPLSEDEVEKLKKNALIKSQAHTVKTPAIVDVFLHERDIYLTHVLQVAAHPRIFNTGRIRYQTVVGVVGMGHVPGIKRLWPHPQAKYIPSIMSIPQPPSPLKFVKLAFSALAGYYIYSNFIRKKKE